MWDFIKVGMAVFVKYFLRYMGGKAGTLKPRLLEKVEHGMGVGGELRFEFLHIGTGGGGGASQRWL